MLFYFYDLEVDGNHKYSYFYDITTDNQCKDVNRFGSTISIPKSITKFSDADSEEFDFFLRHISFRQCDHTSLLDIPYNIVEYTY